MGIIDTPISILEGIEILQKRYPDQHKPAKRTIQMACSKELIACSLISKKIYVLDLDSFIHWYKNVWKPSPGPIKGSKRSKNHA